MCVCKLTTCYVKSLDKIEKEKYQSRQVNFHSRHSYNTYIIDINLHGSSAGRLFSLQIVYWDFSPGNGKVSNMRDENQQTQKTLVIHMYFYSHEDVTIAANVGHLLVAYIVLHYKHGVVRNSSFEGTPYLVVTALQDMQGTRRTYSKPSKVDR